ncbi:MAG: MFS transporter [Lachnospiraceae bacterium]
MNTLTKKITYQQTIYACYVGYAVQAIMNNLSPLLFLTFQKSLGISLEKVGLLVTINFGTQIIVDLLSAKYVDRFGYRTSVIFAHVMGAIGLVGMGVFPFLFADPYAGLVLSAIINAVGGGIIEVLISPIVEAAPSKEKAKAMSMLHSFYCFGHMGVVLLSTLAFGLLGMERWYIVPVIWAIVPFLNCFFFAVVPIKTVAGEEETLPVKKVLSMKLFWLFAILMICAGASEQAMSQWASFFAESGLQISKTLGDLLGPCAFAAMMAVSRVFYGKMGHKIEIQKFMLGSCVLCIVSYLIAVFVPIPLLALAGCALCGLSVGIMWPGTFSMAAKECPQGGTAVWAFLALAGDIGCAAGPTVVSTVSKFFTEYGIKAGLLAAILFPFAMLLIRLQMGRRTLA